MNSESCPDGLTFDEAKKSASVRNPRRKGRAVNGILFSDYSGYDCPRGADGRGLDAPGARRQAVLGRALDKPPGVRHPGMAGASAASHHPAAACFRRAFPDVAPSTSCVSLLFS